VQAGHWICRTGVRRSRECAVEFSLWERRTGIARILRGIQGRGAIKSKSTSKSKIMRVSRGHDTYIPLL